MLSIFLCSLMQSFFDFFSLWTFNVLRFRHRIVTSVYFWTCLFMYFILLHSFISRPHLWIFLLYIFTIIHGFIHSPINQAIFIHSFAFCIYILFCFSLLLHFLLSCLWFSWIITSVVIVYFFSQFLSFILSLFIFFFLSFIFCSCIYFLFPFLTNEIFFLI